MSGVRLSGRPTIILIVSALLFSGFVWLFSPGMTAHPIPETLRAVQYFQADASLRTFWSNLNEEQLSRDFARLKSAGFNAVILMIPWGEFQPTIRPVSYDRGMIEKLHGVLQEAQRQQFWTILRMGTHEIIPQDASGGDYWSGAVLSSDEEFEAYRRLFQEIARQTSQYSRMVYFWSWEDVYMWPKPWFAALESNRRSFQAWCESKNPSPEFWSARWEEPLVDWKDISIPDSAQYAGGAKVGDFWAFQDSLIIRRAPLIAKALREGNPNGTIGYEARIDPDDTYHHRATFQALSGYDFVASWYYPYHGVPLTHVAPLQHVQHAIKELAWQLHTVRAWSGKPAFFEQIGAELRREDPEHQRAFLVNATEFLLTESLGYGIWDWQDYALNFVYNPGFELGLKGWETQGPVEVADGEPLGFYGRHALKLSPGAQASQSISNRGGRTFSCWARCEGSVNQELMVRIERYSGESLQTSEERRVAVSNDPALLVVHWEEGREANRARIILVAPEENLSPVVVDVVKCYDHVSRLGLCDESGDLRQPLFDQLTQVNLRGANHLRWTLWNRWWNFLRTFELEEARFDYAQPPGQGLP